MDIARPEIKRRKKIRRYIYAGIAIVAVVLATAALLAVDARRVARALAVAGRGLDPESAEPREAVHAPA